MEQLPISTFFLLPNQEDSLIISLRSILSHFLLQKTIIPLKDISLYPLLQESKKIIEFKKDEYNEYQYIEHPTSFRLTFPVNTKSRNWNNENWYNWVSTCIYRLHLYPEIQAKMRNFFRQEIENVLGVSKFQLDYLYNNVLGLENEMIDSFFLFKQQLTMKAMKDLKSVDWNTMLSGHVSAMNIIFVQVSSPIKRKIITFNIFEIVRLLYPQLEKAISSPKKLNELVTDFKKECNKVIQNEVSFIETKKILFREWFLSISQFLLYCTPVQFDFKKSILRLQMILYLCFANDQVYQVKDISYRVDNIMRRMPEVNKNKLKEVHPFVRNIYYHHFLL